MKPPTILLDTNLLVLFVVGTTSRKYIEKHKRLTEFAVEEYDALLKIISAASSVLVTPNTLTETSNLAAYIGEPARSEVLQVLRAVISSSQETYVPSRTASERTEFLRLGLTDAALIETATEETVILTTDLGLYLAVLAKGASAINFKQSREIPRLCRGTAKV